MDQWPLHLVRVAPMPVRLLHLLRFCVTGMRWSGVQVIAEHGEALTPAAASAMPYADACVKEALRIAPIVAVVTRVALKTFELGGFTIPKAISDMFHCWLAGWLSVCLSVGLPVGLPVCLQHQHHGSQSCTIPLESDV